MCTSKDCLLCWGMECSVTVNSKWPNMSFKATLLTDFLSNLPTFINASGVTKSSTINAILPVSPFMFVNNCFIYLDVPALGHTY